MDIFWADRKEGNQLIISADEARHISKSLRKKVGDPIAAMTGNGYEYRGPISSIGRNELSVEIDAEILHPPLPYHLTVGIAPLKNESRLEWFVEKSVELGISSIVPMQTKNTIKPSIRRDRLIRIMQAACKQSRHFYLPTVEEMTSLEEIISREGYDEKYIAYVPEDGKTLTQTYQGAKKVIVLIGPEGGFTESEISLAQNQDYDVISLGEYRLRTETAGVAACQMIKSKYELL